MESFKEQTCDFSINYGLAPDVCTSIVFPENHKSKCQRNLELKRLNCARMASSGKKYCLKQCIPKEKLMTHDQWVKRQAKCKDTKPMSEEENIKCAKRMQELSLKQSYKKCPFMSGLQTVLEGSDEHQNEEASSGFDELMLKCIQHHVFSDEQNVACFIDEEELEKCEDRDRTAHSCPYEEARKLSEEFEHIHIPDTSSSEAEHGASKEYREHAMASITAPSHISANRRRHQKVPRGLKKLWKHFHSMCEQSTPNTLHGCETVLNYSPGATPSDLPLFM